MRFPILLLREVFIDSRELEKLVTYYHEKKLAHAYLISTNNINKSLEVLLKVIKNIFCVQEYSDDCNKCSLCHLIELNNLPSLKIITPDGERIKKNQILELKNLFSKDSMYTKESIYIIVNAEKMNKEAANTMLKFLEEPDGDVIGFFLTTEKDNIIPTIYSRCQIIEDHYDILDYESFNVSKDKYQELLQVANEYLQKIEIEKKELILYNRIYLSNLEKEDIKVILQIILSIYKSKLEKQLINDNNIDEYSYLNNLSISNLEKKINLIIELLNEINFNVNLELLLDRLVLQVEVINNETL